MTMSNSGQTQPGPLASTATSVSTSLPSNAPRRTPFSNDRRSNSQQRPSFSPRASSLSISAKLNPSISSNGSPAYLGSSGLKQEIHSSSSAIDPLDNLEAIVAAAGRSSKPDDLQHGSPGEKSCAVNRGIKFGNLSLQDFIQNSETGLKNATNLPEPQSPLQLDMAVGETAYNEPETWLTWKNEPGTTDA